MHGFVKYVHDFGMTELFLEEQRTEKRKKLTTGRNAKQKTLTKEAT
jgi:hypothetical protein